MLGREYGDKPWTEWNVHLFLSTKMSAEDWDFLDLADGETGRESLGSQSSSQHHSGASASASASTQEEQQPQPQQQGDDGGDKDNDDNRNNNHQEDQETIEEQEDENVEDEADEEKIDPTVEEKQQPADDDDADHEQDKSQPPPPPKRQEELPVTTKRSPQAKSERTSPATKKMRFSTTNGDARDESTSSDHQLQVNAKLRGKEEAYRQVFQLQVQRQKEFLQEYFLQKVVVMRGLKSDLCARSSAARALSYHHPRWTLLSHHFSYPSLNESSTILTMPTHLFSTNQWRRKMLSEAKLNVNSMHRASKVRQRHGIIRPR